MLLSLIDSVWCLVPKNIVQVCTARPCYINNWIEKIWQIYYLRFSVYRIIRDNNGIHEKSKNEMMRKNVRSKMKLAFSLIGLSSGIITHSLILIVTTIIMFW